MPASLVSLDGQANIPLDRVLIVVGRHHLCDVRLASGRVSRHHCCLSPNRDGVLVRDLGSTNGTRINGWRTDAGLLRPGDVLTIAHARYRLVVGRASDETAPFTEPPADSISPHRETLPDQTAIRHAP